MKTSKFFIILVVTVGAVAGVIVPTLLKNKRKRAMSNDKNIEKILSAILANEGGYINDLYDAGGETNFGISKRAHPNEDIKNLTVERAIEIYKNEYIAPLYDSIKGYPLNYQYQIIDTAVNCGVSRAKDFNKKAAGDVDKIKQLRTEFYNSIAQGNKERYLDGWLKRVNVTLYV